MGKYIIGGGARFVHLPMESRLRHSQALPVLATHPPCAISRPHLLGAHLLAVQWAELTRVPLAACRSGGRSTEMKGGTTPVRPIASSRGSSRCSARPSYRPGKQQHVAQRGATQMVSEHRSFRDNDANILEHTTAILLISISILIIIFNSQYK